MNWYDFKKEISREVDQLSVIASSLRANGTVQIETLFSMEEKERDAIDEACRQYAKTSRLPSLTQSQAILVYIRLGHAAQFVKFLAIDGGDIFRDEFLDSQKPKVLEFLLVDYWKFAGRSRWRTT